MTSPPAGWYTSPTDSTQPMWWDGEKWCPDGIPPSEPSVQPEQVQAELSHSRNLTSSIALTFAFVAAITAFTPVEPVVRATVGICLAVVGLALAIFGLSKASKNKRSSGRPRGLVRSLAALVASVALLAVLCFGIVETFGTFAANGSRAVPNELDSSTSQNPSPNSASKEYSSGVQTRLNNEYWEGEGFTIVESGNHYYRWMTDEEKANSSCGYNACSFAIIHSEKGCSAGFYVKADILSNGAPIV